MKFKGEGYGRVYVFILSKYLDKLKTNLEKKLYFGINFTIIRQIQGWLNSVLKTVRKRNKKYAHEKRQILWWTSFHF